jgi:2-phospho-L-lactate guanylyltransferase
VDVVVPYAATRPKTRLASVLDASERRAFSRAMLDDVLTSLTATHVDGERLRPTVLATAPVDADVPVTVDQRPLTEAVNAVLSARRPTGDDPVAIVMSDLALATPESFERLCSAPGDVVVAPGLGGGTNCLVVRHPEFRVDYHGASYCDHLERAADVDASVTDVDSRRLAVDVDEPGDLAEVLIHGDGPARDWLRDAGFELDTSEGRVGVTRDGVVVEAD